MTAAESAARDLRKTNLIDGVGATASLACLVHCLALPVLAMLLPGIASLAARSELFHLIAPVLIAPAAVAAFRAGYRQHGGRGPALLGASGIGLLLIALHPRLIGWQETLSTVAGSLALVTAHLLNWRLRRHAGR